MEALHTMASGTTAITDLTGTRIWVNQIPRDTIEAQDVRRIQQMLVLRQAGGAGKADVMPVMNFTFDAVCYGKNYQEANEVCRAVIQRFLTLDRETHDSVLIHHINTTGGPVPSVEPDLVWPVIAQSFTTLADVLEVA